ncbi:MAG: glycoside hydrolase family 9 protein [Oscillospiraceae bacterium]|nr:glycoside hydrolase family 9 protein [Oscillospiraceae bacterium]
MHRKSKLIIAGLLALSMVAPTVASIAPMTVSAGQILGETDFEYKALPWHTCESSPAKQDFELSDGAVHITILKAQGAAKEKWDLQFRCRNLDFKAGHDYKVSFKAKASRDGLELCGKIGQPNSPYEEYFELDENDMHDGPDMGGQYPNSCAKLSTDWKEYSGTFHCTKDLEGMEWAFHYAKGTQYKGNAEDGDEIWFDDMSITCEQEDDVPVRSYGQTDRYWASVATGVKDVFISTNQLGYFPETKKIAVLSDNSGDILHDAEKISLSGTYTVNLVDAKSGSTVKSFTSTAPEADKDSNDKVCKIDFSDFTTPGTYYLQVDGKTWRSFEFKIGDDIYSQKGENSSKDLLTNAINYFYQNRSGCDIESSYVVSGSDKNLAHQGGHITDKAYVQPKWINEYESKTQAQTSYSITANKGWYDAGDHGKYVVNGGISVWTLQNMYERAILKVEGGDKKFADGSGTVVVPETGNKIPDVLDECKYELDFIEAMKVDSKDPTYGSKYEGLYYHKLHDHKWTGLATRPWDYEGPEDQGGWDTVRIVKPPTFAATLNFAACAAQAARLWQDYDSSQAATYLKEAKEAFAAFERTFVEADLTTKTHPDLGCDCPAEELNANSLYAPMWHAKGGGPYGDNEVKDDAYWAACELFTSCSLMKDSDADTYKTALEKYGKAYGGKQGDKSYKVTSRITGGENASGEGSLTCFNWGNTGSAGSLTLALHKDLLDADAKKTLEASILETADEYLKQEEEQGYGIPYTYDGPGYNDPNNLDPKITIYGYEWGSNSMVINNLIAMAYAYDQTGESKYLSGVTTGMDYLLGCNPLAYSYITGYGSYHERNPHHRYWSHELDKTLPEAPDGVLSGGPNAGLQDPYVRALGFVPGKKDNPSQRCYVDSIEAWSTNEVTINWNAPLAWIVEFLQDKDNIKDVEPITTSASSETTEKSETTASSSTTTKDDVDWGNVDLSKGDTPEMRVDVSDAVLLARFVAEDAGANVSAQGKLNADVNANGKPDADDTLKILQFIAKIIPYSDLGKA